MIKTLIFALFIVSMFVSCKTKEIYSGSTIYKLSEDKQAHKNQLQSFKIDTYDGDFGPDANNIIVLDAASTKVKSDPPKKVYLKTMPSLQTITLDDYFFGDVSGIAKSANKRLPGSDADFPIAKSLAYRSNYFVLQGLSVPYKIRTKLSGPQYATPISSTVETGFTANLSVGYKLSWNFFRPNKDFLGLNLNSISITPGVFAGLGTVGLSSGNTLNEPSTLSRTALVKSYGLFALIGFSRFGIGYAGGWDYASGEGASNWVYKGKWWNGFALSIDLINF